MNINIRHEEPKDYKIVEEITRDAFWNLHVPGCDEHLIAHQLRNHPDYISELSFVIEVDGEVVGSIFYSKSKVVDGDSTFDIATFGPVSISPSFQKKGLGEQLIRHSIEEVRKLGYQAIIIGGFPAYYKKYGFAGIKKYHIAMPDGCYYTGIMALPLKDGAFEGIENGVLYFSDVFEVDEKELTLFDAEFDPKEKEQTESQKRFEKAVVEQDTKEY